jgi:hypothetical protein
MNPLRRFLRQSIRRLGGLFREPPGLSLGVQVPADPVEHASQFALKWWDKLDEYAAVRMEELGIPLERIGLSDHKHGIPWCAFNPFDKTGGGFGPGGRIELDSGVFNPDLKAPLGRKADAAWKKARLRTRMDSVIAHEYEEGSGYSHGEAVERAPDTELPIPAAARELARTIRDGDRKRKRSH